MEKRIFDTITQELKYDVLKEVAKLAYSDRLCDSYYAIPRILIKDGVDAMHCCIYKDRAVVEEMVRFAVGIPNNPDAVIDVLDIACDECPIDKYTISDGCRNCISHKCIQACPQEAITIGSNRKAVINQEKCIECGRCFRACSYSAIREQIRPCVKSCKINAIKVDQNRKAKIDHSKCISCGACMTKCPFGAIQDRSYILEAIKLLKEGESGAKKVYMIIAPAIVNQFRYASVEQVVTGIKMLGVFNVVEAALGADLIAFKETEELLEKGKLLSSCCPSFVDYVKKNFTALVPLISSTPSPMTAIGKKIKEQNEDIKIIFAGPCISKKVEFKQEGVSDIIDCVITFEELQALLDSRNIHCETLEPSPLDNASYFGRMFATSGGVTNAIKSVATEIAPDFNFNPLVADGLDQIKIALLKLNKNLIDNNFIEGMACGGGCISGAGCINHNDNNIKEVENYANTSLEKDVCSSIKHII
ncbi:MAG: monomeric [FeFe] hydrogenase [Clostridia bacterium]